MYLKSIEIQGFKSFANKIKFEFHNGITAIVGPNGSGKSNVADAVRWVLGEQRIKQLRGASMQDVIFAGTELRKPLGFASVAITLDNSDHQLAVDYEEVTVCRRIYRSGESEYLINGTTCRLRDINELFYDTGIGKEGYSIIGQGQIDKILSDKPEDRRELFDEASGIVKFKRRKDTALKKLEREKENLVRISDILAELERQVGPLERQSEKAREYLKYYEELKTLDVNAFLLEYEDAEKKIKDAADREKIAQDDLAASREQYDTAKVEYDEIREVLDELESNIEETRNKTADAGVAKSRLEGDVKVYREQINSAVSSSENCRTRIDEASSEYEEKKTYLQQLKDGAEESGSKLDELIRKKNEVQAKLDETQGHLRRENAAADEVKEQQLTLLNNRAVIRSRIAGIEASAEQIRIRKDELGSRITEALSSTEEQQGHIRELREEFASSGEKVRELQAALKRINEEIAKKKQELIAGDEKLRSTQQAYHQEKSRLDALSNLAQRYEGFGNSVKKVMENKSRESGLIGVVADLIKTESRYETAIEIALGGSIQNVVTEDEATAKRMIEMLKREKAGRATFLPLTSIKRQQDFKNRKILEEPGVIGLADTLVHTDDAYRSVAQFLLGRVVIVDSFEHAVSAARKFGHSVRMVTLDGELFAAGGAISGGAYRSNSNLLGRRREIEELRNRTKARQTQQIEIDRQIQEIKEKRNELRAELAETERLLQEEYLRQNTLRVSIQKEQSTVDEAAESADRLRREKEAVDLQIENGSKDLALAQSELAASMESETQLSEQESLLAEKIRELTALENTYNAEASAWDVEVEKFRQRQQFDKQNLDRLEEELRRLEQEMETLRRSEKDAQTLIAERSEKIAELEESIRECEQLQEESSGALQSLQERKSQLSARRQKIQEQREALSERISALDKECYRLHAQYEKMQENIESRITYMWEEYEVTPGTAAALRDESLTNFAEIKKSISTLRGKIKNLGSVNVNAIEEYKEVSERYNFLKGQHDDLVKAAETLVKIIDELDVSMRKQFREQFAKIADEFDRVFKELFGGGTGKLELTEAEDVLEAGIRVIAQPPGKKLQNMMQLSGGEKALSAIALLFAIQNLKPSPFCLLDEIEAALDESNVVRFSSYLHKLTQYTQFIVITHRRGTMEEADRLYGITMQEKGVSALVSVNLLQEEIDD